MTVKDGDIGRLRSGSARMADFGYLRQLIIESKAWTIQFCVLVLATILITVYFRSLGVYSQFLRCESGTYLNYAANWKIAKSFWLSNLATDAYNGHYAPIAFGLELIQERLIGLHPGLWMIRQSFLLAFLGMSFATFIKILGKGRLARPWIAAATISAIYIAQPAFIDFVAWPFMIMQFGCLSFACLGLSYLVKYCRDGSESSLLLCLLFSYGTMQWFGVGLAFNVASLGTIAWLVLKDITVGKIVSKNKIYILVTFSVVTIVHAYVMVFRNYGEVLPFPTLSFVMNHMGAFFLRMLFSGLQSIWMPGTYSLPNPSSFAADNIYGWASIIVISIIVFSSLSVSDSSHTNEYAIIMLYTLIGSLIYVSLMLLRLQTTPDNWKGAFVVGPRYVVFGSFFIILLFVSLFIEISGPVRLGNFSMLLLVVAAIVGNALFIRDTMPLVWPATLSNNSAAWDRT